MIKLFRKLAKNNKGSEVVEKILMVVVSLAIGAAAVVWIWKMVSDASKTGDDGEVTNPGITDPNAGA